MLSDAAGVRVIVHNQTEMAFPEDAGFSVNPGHKTSVALSKVGVTTLCLTTNLVWIDTCNMCSYMYVSTIQSVGDRPVMVCLYIHN